jgi:hypothetical protein
MSTAALAHEVVGARASAIKARSGGLQIAPPDDAFEREANRVADEATDGRDVESRWSLSKMSVWPALQRKCDCGGSSSGGGECEECKKGSVQRMPADVRHQSEAPPIVHQALNSPGKRLDSATRGYMERRLGHDFGKVRIHAGDTETKSAEAIGALAYTVGSDVVFGKDQYSPHTASGRKLIAHELTHVVQQSGTVDLRRPQRLAIGAADDAFERQAEMAARSLAQSTPTRTAPSLSRTPAVQRLGAGFAFLRFFGIEAGDFSEGDLTEYLDRIAKNRQCDCGLFKFLSDDMARDIVKRWGVGEYKLDQDYKGVPTVEIKRILIQELLSGVTTGPDEEAIIKILEKSAAEQVKQLLDPTHGLTIQNILDSVTGDNQKKLLGVLARQLPDIGVPNLKRSEQPGEKSGACTVTQAVKIHFAHQTAQTLVQNAIQMLDQFAAKPAENKNVERLIDCYFHGANAGQIRRIRQDFQLVDAELPKLLFVCPAEPFKGFRTSAGEEIKPEEGVLAQAPHVEEKAAKPSAVDGGKAPAKPPQQTGAVSSPVLLYPDFFTIDPSEMARIVIHEAFHHATKQGTVKEIYKIECGDPPLAAALTNAQSYSMFAAQLAQSGLHVKLEDCPDAWKAEVIAASRTAEIWVADAVVKLDALLANPNAASSRTRENLKRHFKTEPSATKVVRQIRESFGEIQAAFGGELPLQCESEGKPDVPAKTGGFMGVSPRGGNIHLYPYWFDKLDHSERAETILHEMAHRFAGKGGFGVELYMKDPRTARQYAALSTDDALSNADSFAQFARMEQVRPDDEAPAAPEKATPP